MQALFADTPVLLPHIQGGKLADRCRFGPPNPRLADVGTLAEQACRHRRRQMVRVARPRQDAAAVIAKLRDAVVAAIEAPEIRAKLVQSGAVPAPTWSDGFGTLLRDEHARWGRVVREKSIEEE